MALGKGATAIAISVTFLQPASGLPVPQDVELINATIADNAGAGLRVVRPPHPSLALLTVSLKNTIVFRNLAGNCVGFSPASNGANLQFPNGSCGAGIPVAFPLLGPRYAPLERSPARGHGDDAVCAAPPIAGVDLFGERRNGPHPCSIGAVERDTELTHERRRDDHDPPGRIPPRLSPEEKLGRLLLGVLGRPSRP